jgi:hypothetical protein
VNGPFVYPKVYPSGFFVRAVSAKLARNRSGAATTASRGRAGCPLEPRKRTSAFISNFACVRGLIWRATGLGALGLLGWRRKRYSPT